MAKLTKDSFPNLPMRMKYITCGCDKCKVIYDRRGHEYMNKQLLSFIKDIQTALWEANNG